MGFHTTLIIISFLALTSNCLIVPASNFSSSCFGCLFNNYVYCAEQMQCVNATQSCIGIQYTNITGCPVTSKCNVGIDGFLRIDNNSSHYGALNTIKNGLINITAPAHNPCSLVLQNPYHKYLTWTVTGSHVGAQYA